MAVSYNDLWKKQKQSGVYQTRDGGTVTGAKKGSGANTVSSASANLGAGKATGGISGGDTGYAKSTKKSSGKSSNASGLYAALLTNNTMPKATYSAPTVGMKPVVAKTPTTLQNATKNIATNAYKQKLAAAQNRAYSYDDENEKKNPDMGIVYGANEVAKQSANLDQRNIPGTSSYTFSQAMDPEYEYKTYAQQKAEAEQAAREKEAADRKAQEEYNKWLAEQEAIAAQEAAEEEREREMEEALAEQEAYYQAIIDAYNAQAAANMQMLQNQSGVLNQQYDNNAANLYAQYRRSGLAMPELMAGTATGIADSYTLQNNLNFQNNLVENELERASAQNQLNAQMNEIQANADLQAAQTAADWAQMAYQQRLAAQKANTGTTNNGNNTTKQETVDEPVAVMTSAQALLAAKQYSADYKQQLAYLQQMWREGKISDDQYSDLKVALDPQYSYK